MPFILDENTQENLSSVQTTITPKFFSQSLTGNGKTRGYLSNAVLPARSAAEVKSCPQSCRNVKATTSTGTSDYEFIPMNLLDFTQMTTPGLPAEAIRISDVNMEPIYAYVTMHSCVFVTDNKDDPALRTKTLYPVYNIYIFTQTGSNWTMHKFTEKCLNTQQFTSLFPHIDTSLLNDYFGNLTVYDIICETACMWDKQIPEIVKTALDNNIDERELVCLSARLNNYSVNLNDYKCIYDTVYAKNPALMEKMTEHNLNLLLNAILKTLENNKNNVPKFTPVPYTNGKINLSSEQIKAVTTTEPCVIVQAGAGTGKSTVIQNRLGYLKTCGVDLANVMVLSFTNAAADHIKAISPEVNSKTIASMINDIYSLNWDHELSTIDTMLNVLKANDTIYSRNNQVGLSLINALTTLRKNTNSGLIALSNLISKHFDETMAILDYIRQTTLEIQSIVCYYAKNLKEPQTTCTHLIMDEVQDNSIFEFIYVVNYVVNHNANLYFVGDCSQTLYEFRASNPKALNCLEMSGIFECMQLQTNYRSNQNILDFANLLLKNIEANQFAKIQLKANNYQTRSFDEDITVRYNQLRNKSSLKDSLPMMLIQAKDWIQDKLDKHEQICFLAYRRQDIKWFKDNIGKLFPNDTSDADMVDITPSKSFMFSFFSKYIYYYMNDFHHCPGKDATAEIAAHIAANDEKLCYQSYQIPILHDQIKDWHHKEQQMFFMLDRQLMAGRITEKEFKQNLMDSLIDYEIAQNAMRQRLMSQKNSNKKNLDISKFKFVFSTIHSAKGLEFDNVILLYDESRKSNEEDKRMYYVGLTRAKNAEYVMAYNVTKSSEIQAAFEGVCSQKGISSSKTGDKESCA